MRKAEKGLWIMWALVAFAFASLAFFRPALAGEIDINFDWPTQQKSPTGVLSPLPASGLEALKSTTLEYGTCGANITTFGTKLGEFVINFPTATFNRQDLPPGVTCMRMRVSNNANVLSDYTNVFSKTVVANQPLPPNNLRIAANEVFQIIGTKDRVAFLPVGTVPSDTPCDATQPMGDKYVVPLKDISVTWYGRTRPQVVVAKCS